jgi:AAA domain
MNQIEQEAQIFIPHAWKPKGVGQLAAMQPDPSKTLLGDRWLCRGGALLMVGQTGVGKSSASMQQDVLWSIGQEAFGIVPNGPLEILTIQVENDDGDLGKMCRGVMDGLKLTPMERALVDLKVNYHTLTTGETGVAFINELDRYLSGLEDYEKPDLIRIDPLSAFIGGNINDAEEVAEFLYQHLKPLLIRYDCGAVLVHHTGKPSRGDRKSRPDDYIYDGMGSSILSNFVRAGLNIESTPERGAYRFRITKRFSGHGWTDPVGNTVHEKWYKHGDNFWVWEPCDPVLKKAEKKTYSTEHVLMEIPLSPKEGIYLSELKNRLREKQAMTDRSIKGLIDQLLDEGRIVQKEGVQKSKKGGRKPIVIHRVAGFAGYYTDENDKVQFKSGGIVDTPLLSASTQ